MKTFHLKNISELQGFQCGVDVCEDKKAYKDCVRMYRALYPKSK